MEKDPPEGDQQRKQTQNTVKKKASPNKNERPQSFENCGCQDSKQ